MSVLQQLLDLINNSSDNDKAEILLLAKQIIGEERWQELIK